MKNFYTFIRFFFLLFCVTCVVFLTWCSMVPTDEEIINWSVVDSEIFWNELIDDWLDNEVSLVNSEEWDEQKNLEDYDVSDDSETVEDDEDWNSEVNVEVVK